MSCDRERDHFVVGHFVFEHAVDEDGELASGRRNGFGLFSSSGEPATERPKRMVAATGGTWPRFEGSWLLGSPRAACENSRSFPPEILLFGASVSQEAK